MAARGHPELWCPVLHSADDALSCCPWPPIPSPHLLQQSRAPDPGPPDFPHSPSAPDSTTNLLEILGHLACREMETVSCFKAGVVCLFVSLFSQRQTQQASWLSSVLLEGRTVMGLLFAGCPFPSLAWLLRVGFQNSEVGKQTLLH